MRPHGGERRRPTPGRDERLAAQGLAGDGGGDVASVVRRMVALQAQDYYGCLWAVGVRTQGVRARDVEEALDDGVILRTHALRGTWQLTAPEDLRMLLRLTRAESRVLASAARRHDELGLDARTLAKALAAIERDLVKSGGDRTRAEIAAIIEGAGVSTEGQRLSHILIHAELHELLTSGRRRGKQVTAALLDARAPLAKNARVLEGKEAHVEIARRFLATRAPATAADFAWWTGLPANPARVAWVAASTSAAHPAPAPRATPTSRGASAHLLPPFDEYLVSYKDRSAVLRDDHVKSVNAGGGLLAPVVVVDGAALGTWRRTLGKRIDVEYAWFEGAPSKAVRVRVAEAEERWRAFLG